MINSMLTASNNGCKQVMYAHSAELKGLTYLKEMMMMMLDLQSNIDRNCVVVIYLFLNLFIFLNFGVRIILNKILA